MTKEKVERQLAAYETQMKDCEARIKATSESYDQLIIQKQQLQGAIFAAKETLVLFEVKQDENPKKEDENAKS